MASTDIALKRLPPSAMLALLMLNIFMPAACSVVNVNCTEPNQPALLKALTPLFNLSAIRPVVDSSTCTNITISFTLYGILGVDEKAQLLNTYIWLNYWWKNELVTWDPDRCGSDKISLPREKFWVPDIVINEFMDENTAPPVPYVYLHSDGTVHDAHPVKIVSSCNLDIYTFPFDIQNCTLTFNSYIHYALDIKVLLGTPPENITERSKRVITTLGEWELLDITAHDSKETEGLYIDTLAFHIRLRRRATLYVVNLLIPSCFLITVDLFSFLLPPQSVDRSSFKMTLILGYTVFLLIMNDLLPVTGNAIPLINVFFSLCLALMVASLLETIFITNLLSGAADFGPMPRWIRKLFLRTLGPLVCLPHKKKKPKPSEIPMKVNTVAAQGGNADGPPGKSGPAGAGKAVEELKSLGKDVQALRLQVEQQLSGNASTEDWIQVGFIIDRLLFGLYILFITCCQLKVKPSQLLFLFISLLLCAPSTPLLLNCSRPDSPSLLEALKPVFKLSPIRPVMNSQTTTNVSLSFTLFGILGVDEKAQVLTTFIWQVLQWRNEFVEWDPEECGSYRITVPRKRLWVPDVVINEFMEKNSAPFVPYTYMFSDGMVIDGQPVRVVSSCRLDIYNFPFDVQNCSLSFNSYTHHRAELEMELVESAESIFRRSKAVMTTMGEWELVGITFKTFEFTSGIGEIYEELRFFIAVRRRATLYVVNLLIPTCFLITVDLFSFLLPPKSVDRSLFKMTLILGYTVFLLSMNDLLPVSGDTIPLINVFLTLCLSLMVASLLETIIITNLLCGSAHSPPAPRWIRLLVLHVLGRLVGLPPKAADGVDTVIQNPEAQDEVKVPPMAAEEREGPEQEEPLGEEEALQALRSLGVDLRALRQQLEQQLGGSRGAEDWNQVGLVIDRLLFILYILFISVSFVTITTLWLRSYNTDVAHP